jgi:hypothetical protein
MRWATQRGQAMIELAVFGSLIIGALGVLLRYALTAQYTQQTRMRAFRNTLMLASRPAPDDGRFPVGGGSSLLYDERLIVDPGDTFGIGGLAGLNPAFNRVTRDVRMDTLETRDILVRVELNGQALPETPSPETGSIGPDLESDSERATTMDTVLLKSEDENQITTVSGVAWTEREEGRPFEHPSGDLATQEIRNEHSTTVWTTPWE